MKPTKYIHTEANGEQIEVTTYPSMKEYQERERTDKAREARALVDDEQPTDRISF